MVKNLLFDLDDTILDFKAAEEAAISTVLVHYGFRPTPELLSDYSRVNLGLWEKLERREILIDEVLHSRFEIFFRTLGRTVEGPEVEKVFRRVINEHAQLVPGALDLLSGLSGRFGIYAVSNGLYDTQLARLGKAGIRQFFDNLFISESVGVNKPDARFFSYVSQHIPGFSPREALVIGDSLTSDIQGGFNAGIPTCWFNRFSQARPELSSLRPDFEIRRLAELPGLLGLDSLVEGDS